MIFTNPEGVVKRLAKPLTKAAEQGRLGLLAIDEAHVVLSWGDAFRPYFQALAGFRRHLHRTAIAAGHEPCKTILASATLTEDAVALLDALFGDPTPIIAVQAPTVRPEPIYWGLTDIPGDLREERLLEALRHLPRPAIVYTTLRHHQPYRPSSLTPRRLVKELQDLGFCRVAAIDGGEKLFNLNTAYQTQSGANFLRFSNGTEVILLRTEDRNFTWGRYDNRSQHRVVGRYTSGGKTFFAVSKDRPGALLTARGRVSFTITEISQTRVSGNFKFTGFTGNKASNATVSGEFKNVRRKQRK